MQNKMEQGNQCIIAGSHNYIFFFKLVTYKLNIMYALKNEIMRSKFKNKNIADALLGNFILTISSSFFFQKTGIMSMP